MCVKNCNYEGVSVADKKAVIDEEKCVGCGHCFAFCPKGAIECKWDIARALMNKKMAEYAKAVLYGKPSFHISFVMDVSPDCDCEPMNDVPVVGDIGIFAGFDPVAIDQACADRVNAAPVLPGSKAEYKLHKHGIEDCTHEGHDLFTMIHPNSEWESCLEHAVKLGLGKREYEIVSI